MRGLNGRLYCKKPMTEMSAGIYGGGGEATTPIYSGGNTCTVVFSVESWNESYRVQKDSDQSHAKLQRALFPHYFLRLSDFA